MRASLPMGTRGAEHKWSEGSMFNVQFVGLLLLPLLTFVTGFKDRYLMVLLSIRHVVDHFT